VHAAGRLGLLIGILLAAFGSSPASAQTAPDSELPVGRFYTQAGSGGGYGYRISDEAGIGFWSEFQRLGGVPALGYPTSKRFMLDGYMVQATQKVIMQWRPDFSPPGVSFMNVFDKLHDLGMDDVLESTYQVPAPFDQGEFNAGKTPPQARADRLTLLNGDPAIAARYNAAGPSPLAAFGLPTSTITNEGPFFAVRMQRAVLQHWLVDNPAAGVNRGDVTVVNGGDIAKRPGLIPSDAGGPETINGVSAATPTPVPPPAPPPPPPAPPGTAAVSSQPGAAASHYAWMWKKVSTPPTDCGPSQVLLGYLAPHQFSCDDSAPNGGTQFIIGHTLDQSGHAVSGIIVRASAYGNNYDGGSDQDGTFGIIISNSCPIENRTYNLYVIDGQGQQSSNIYPVNYSNCNLAGEFHVDFIKTGP
jgi:hypothetical protein